VSVNPVDTKVRASAAPAGEPRGLGWEAAGIVEAVGGAVGGVGSILTQLARRLTKLTVVGTASRPETEAWVHELGAHHVVDHRRPLAAALRAAGIVSVTRVAGLRHTEQHLTQVVEALAAQGKSLSLHWEFMFTRSMFATADMQAQNDLLGRVADLIDAGSIRSTLGGHHGPIHAANLKRAHAHVETGSARGKVVLEGF
jgi:NADPH:quinone reductase-like Zn-dependent oxidoreductase